MLDTDFSDEEDGMYEDDFMEDDDEFEEDENWEEEYDFSDDFDQEDIEFLEGLGGPEDELEESTKKITKQRKAYMTSLNLMVIQSTSTTSMTKVTYKTG